MFIVLDSLRWDIFNNAQASFLKGLGEWKKATTQGTYTLPAHMSFFIGKLPQTLEKSELYDTVAVRYQPEKGIYRNSGQLWRLTNPESPGAAIHILHGRNIIEGFRSLGYKTICSGAVNWFNPVLPAAKYLTDPFEELEFFGHFTAETQINWAIERVRNSEKEDKPYFLFLNFGETHHPFRYSGCTWGGNPYGNRDECLKLQTLCLEFLDIQMKHLFAHLENFDLVICSDHGEVMGEDGLWGHGFCHEKIMEVPLLIKVNEK